MKNVVKKRFIALLIDWGCICLYLIALALIMVGGSFFILGKIPDFTEIQAQLIATSLSVIPIIIWFTIMESHTPYGSIGKRKMNLRVLYQKSPLAYALIRNIIKFLPWQLAHISVIDGFYSDVQSPIIYVLLVFSLLLPILYIMQVLFTKEHRHVGDILTETHLIETGSVHN